MLALLLQRRLCWLPLLMRPCGSVRPDSVPRTYFGHKLRFVWAVRLCLPK